VEFLNIFKWFFLGIYTILTIIPRYFILGIIYLSNPKKGKEIIIKGKPVIPIMMITLTLTTYFICVFLATRWYVQKLKIDYIAEDILSDTEILEQVEEKETIKEEDYTPIVNNKYENIKFMSVDLKSSKEKNQETVAWLKVNNTNINYPVVQTKNNEYYLRHDFNKRYNTNGWVFADYRADFRYFGNNTIIYAHNLTNRQLFGSLVWTLKSSWYKKDENQYIKLSTEHSNTVWKIFSIYTTHPETYYLKTYFSNNEEHNNFLNKIEKRSIYDFNNDPLDTNTKILTLSTCTDDGKKRIVIHAYMIKAQYK
jgi:sortase B